MLPGGDELSSPVSNVIEKRYIVKSGVESTEEFSYDINNLTVFHKDRDNFVLRTFRSDCGKVQRMVSGLVLTSPNDPLDVDDDGVRKTQAPPDDELNSPPIDQRFQYGNGLLAWIARTPYDESPLDGTSFVYYDNQRLHEKIDPQPPSQILLGPPSTEITWDGDQLIKISNELEQETDYLYDSLGRLSLTTYDDATTEGYRYDLAEAGETQNVVESKNRVGVVTRDQYDLAGRLVLSVPAYADGANAVTWVGNGQHTQLPQDLSTYDRTSITYRAGHPYDQPHRIRGNGGTREYRYDYRGRLINELKVAAKDKFIQDTYQYQDNQIFKHEYKVGYQLGDVNGDGVADLLDRSPFVELITGGSVDSLAALAAADVNQDGNVNLVDVQPFVDLIRSAEPQETTQHIFRRTFFAYDAESGKASRTIRMRHAGVPGYSDIAAVFAEDSIAGDPENPDYIIEDVTLDGRGNIIEETDGRGTVKVTHCDGHNNPVRVVEDSGGFDLTTKYAYSEFGNLEEMILPTGQTTAYGSSLLDSGSGGGFSLGGQFAFFAQTRAAQTANLPPEDPDNVSLQTSFEYDLLGRRIRTRHPRPNGTPDTDQDNPIRTTDVFYQDICCERFMATRNALGDTTIEYRDGVGRLVREMTVDNYVEGDGLSPSDDKKVRENSCLYRPDNLKEFSTVWRNFAPVPAEGFIGDATPPISGVNGPVATTGVTQRFMYDFDLTDGVGLDSTTGESINRIWDGGQAGISIAPAIAKLAEPVAAGGADLSFGADSPGVAVAVVSPDEEIVQVTILDGAERQVMLALIGGPAAPNSDDVGRLIDWTCTVYDNAAAVDGQALEELQRSYFVTAESNSGARSQKMVANGYRWPVRTTDEENRQTIIGYDAQGNRRNVTNALNQEFDYVFDELGRQTSMTDQTLGITNSVSYDSVGRMETRIDGKGQLTTYENFDGLDRPRTLRDRLNHLTLSSYNLDGGQYFQNTVTDAAGKTTTYTLDELHRRKSITLADGTSTDYDYDAANRISRVDLDSGAYREVEYAYSGVTNEVRFFNNAGVQTSVDRYGHNDALQRIEASRFLESSGNLVLDHKLVRDFTLRGQLAFERTEYENQQLTVDYAYDSRGRIEQLTYPSGRNARYGYTDRNQLETIHWGAGNGNLIETRGYNPIRQLTSCTRPSGANEIRNYDSLRLTSIS